MAVTPADIAAALGVAAPDSESTQYAQWSLWVEDARFLISARLGDLAELDSATVDYVVRQAVVYFIQHPDDATQVSVSVDDGSVSRTYRSASGRVSILDEWWNLLDPDIEDSGAFSVTPYFEPDVVYP